MKPMTIILGLFILAITANCHAQKDLSQYESVEGVYIMSYWGDVLVNTEDSNKAQEFNLTAKFTDTSKQTKVLKDLSNYVTFEVINNKLYVSARAPKGFESIDFTLNLPKEMFLEIELLKGGNIYVNNLDNGVEINSLNGSVKIKDIGKYALVNAANGEINASFKFLDNELPISLVTMNGGVTVSIPEQSQRDLRLISRKNGYVLSDFKLETDKSISNLNVKDYSKKPIISKAKINGGGALIFLSTENGPITIKKYME